MKEGFILKSNSKSPSDHELALINNFTRREFSIDELYVFSVVLCDNEIDRDFEQFNLDALQKLAKLFIGKTGIADHSNSSKDQTARIFTTNVEAIPERFNSLGDPYYRLVAKAYLPKSEKNQDFILSLDSGITKEVSVGCSVSKSICSICGANALKENCGHVKGQYYDLNGKKLLCFRILADPTDAYEWSFVAVPAQKNAGVIKSYKASDGLLFDGKDFSVDELKQALSKGDQVALNKTQTNKLCELLDTLSSLSRSVKEYKLQLQDDLVKLSALSWPDFDPSVMKRVASNMSVDDLRAFKEAFHNNLSKVIPPKPQLAPAPRQKDLNNTQFKI